MKLITNFIVSAVHINAFVVVTAIAALAQQGSSGVPPVIQSRDAETMRQRPLRRLHEKISVTTDQRYVRAILAQIEQDFQRLQVLHNEIVRAVKTESALDYKRISEVTAEVKKRAGRLKGNLALPNPKDDEKEKKGQSELSSEQMKDALMLLCHHIGSFVTNPFFEASVVIDLEQSTRASRDLKSVIELSGSIRKSLEKLNEK